MQHTWARFKPLLPVAENNLTQETTTQVLKLTNTRRGTWHKYIRISPSSTLKWKTIKYVLSNIYFFAIESNRSSTSITGSSWPQIK